MRYDTAPLLIGNVVTRWLSDHSSLAALDCGNSVAKLSGIQWGLHELSLVCGVVEALFLTGLESNSRWPTKRETGVQRTDHVQALSSLINCK